MFKDVHNKADKMFSHSPSPRTLRSSPKGRTKVKTKNLWHQINMSWLYQLSTHGTDIGNKHNCTTRCFIMSGTHSGTPPMIHFTQYLCSTSGHAKHFYATRIVTPAVWPCAPVYSVCLHADDSWYTAFVFMLSPSICYRHYYPHFLPSFTV